jgi:hypothetical protein
VNQPVAGVDNEPPRNFWIGLANSSGIWFSASPINSRLHTVASPRGHGACLYPLYLAKLASRFIAKEALNKTIPFMVRQAHHERNQTLTVRPEPVEGFNQQFPNHLKKWGIQFSSRAIYNHPCDVIQKYSSAFLD